MKLREFLLRQTKAGDVVIITDYGYQIGCTYIDYEDLFLGSLNPRMLENDVKSNRYGDIGWCNRPVLFVEIGK